MKPSRSLLAPLALAALLGGCHQTQTTQPGKPAAPAAPTPQQVKAVRQAQASDRQLLGQIPPPAKSRYMAIHTKAGWENPFLTVSGKTVSLRIMYPEAPRSNLIPGTLLQPANARKRVLQLRLADLPEALASLPEDSWPYGRVIALEEDPNEVPSDRIQIRRNVESTIQTLNDLGVIVYEWPGLK
jgi:hypothetical protein